MSDRNRALLWSVFVVLLVALCGRASGQEAAAGPPKVYVPYEKLKGVFETERQGVFLPYTEFQRLWRLASGAPAEVRKPPAAYLISTARFTGKVAEEVARMHLELTVDILAEGWVEAPIGLGDVAVVEASFTKGEGAKARPLLRVVGGQYKLITKGKGRRVLKVEFVRQLASRPGLKVLSFRMPPAAITTLELLIPEENMKVDVEPTLAATASQVQIDGKKATKLQAFLGSAKQVKLSWKPKTQAAVELEPVIISEQLQHIHVAEALISYDVTFKLDIRRRGVDAFTVQLPSGFRVTSVEGANISKWDLLARAAPAGPAVQNLQVKLFAPAKDAYAVTVKMERFLKDPKVQIPLMPIVLQQALRRTGLIAITHSPRRTVEVSKLKNLARVDTGRLPANLRKRAGVTAYRFITSDYGAALGITAVSPRITVNQLWALGVRADRLELNGRLNYKIERAGLFQLTMNLPEPWEILSLGPSNLVDDHQLSGRGRTRTLTILLKRELTGSFHLDLTCSAARAKRDADVEFSLPLADAKDVQLYSGQLVLLLAEQFRAEAGKLDQLHSLPVSRASQRRSFPGLAPAMAFEFRAIDRSKPAGAKFRIAVKPVQISAVVHRLVDIQPGSIEQEAVIEYRIRYAPVDTFYVKLPAAMADAGVQISGRDIKEKPRLDALPPEQVPAGARPAGSQPGIKWTYYKVVLQSPVIGTYRLYVRLRRSFQAGEVGRATTVVVEPILAAGKLSDQSGHIAIAKADTLAIGEPTSRNLIPADAGSAADLPQTPHRKRAFLAFKYTGPPFALSLPVATQEEAAVFATIVSGAIVEQVLARDGKLNAHVIYLLATSRGDRLPITLPEGADLFAVLLNGTEAALETTAQPNQRIVRLPPSAGQVSKFVLEISYGVDNASASELAVPALPEGVPVQQTLWRLWVPQDDYVLRYDRDFSCLGATEARRMLAVLGEGQPSQVAFKLSPQGKQLNLIRQGAPGVLSVTLADKEVFGIILWVVILAAGVAMLKLAGFHRCLIVLGVLVIGFIVRMFAPLLIDHIFLLGVWAAGIVLLLWIAYWMFVVRPAAIRASRPPAPPPPESAAGEKPAAEEGGAASDTDAGRGGKEA